MLNINLRLNKMLTGISEGIVPLRRSAIGHVKLSRQVCGLSSVEFGRKESVWVFGLVEMLHCSVPFDLQKIKKRKKATELFVH